MVQFLPVAVGVSVTPPRPSAPSIDPLVPFESNSAPSTRKKQRALLLDLVLLGSVCVLSQSWGCGSSLETPLTISKISKNRDRNPNSFDRRSLLYQKYLVVGGYMCPASIFYSRFCLRFVADAFVVCFVLHRARRAGIWRPHNLAREGLLTRRVRVLHPLHFGVPRFVLCFVPYRARRAGIWRPNNPGA